MVNIEEVSSSSSTSPDEPVTSPESSTNPDGLFSTIAQRFAGFAETNPEEATALARITQIMVRTYPEAVQAALGVADRVNYFASHYLSWVPFMGGIAERISSATAGIPSSLRQDPDALDERINALLVEVLGEEKAAHLWDTNDGNMGLIGTPESLEGVSAVELEDGDGIVGEACAICMEEYNIGDKCYKMSCGHYLHEECGRRWLRRAPTCPICRAKMTSHDLCSASNDDGGDHSESSTFSDGHFTRRYESNGDGFTIQFQWQLGAYDDVLRQLGRGSAAVAKARKKRAPEWSHLEPSELAESMEQDCIERPEPLGMREKLSFIESTQARLKDEVRRLDALAYRSGKYNAKERAVVSELVAWSREAVGHNVEVSECGQIALATCPYGTIVYGNGRCSVRGGAVVYFEVCVKRLRPSTEQRPSGSRFRIGYTLCSPDMLLRKPSDGAMVMEDSVAWTVEEGDEVNMEGPWSPAVGDRLGLLVAPDDATGGSYLSVYINSVSVGRPPRRRVPRLPVLDRAVFVYADLGGSVEAVSLLPFPSLPPPPSDNSVAPGKPRCFGTWSRVGRNIVLSSDGKLASVIDHNEPYHRVVMGDGPLVRIPGLGWYYALRVKRMVDQSRFLDGLTVGVVRLRQQLARPPMLAAEMAQPAMLMGFNGQSFDTSIGEYEQTGWRPTDLRAGQVIGLLVREGSMKVILYVDGQQMAVASQMPSLAADEKLWPVVDLLGTCDAVSIITRPPLPAVGSVTQPVTTVDNLTADSTRSSLERVKAKEALVEEPPTLTILQEALKPVIDVQKQHSEALLSLVHQVGSGSVSRAPMSERRVVVEVRVVNGHGGTDVRVIDEDVDQGPSVVEDHGSSATVKKVRFEEDEEGKDVEEEEEPPVEESQSSHDSVDGASGSSWEMTSDESAADQNPEQVTGLLPITPAMSTSDRESDVSGVHGDDELSGSEGEEEDSVSSQSGDGQMLGGAGFSDRALSVEGPKTMAVAAVATDSLGMAAVATDSEESGDLRRGSDAISETGNGSPMARVSAALLEALSRPSRVGAVVEVALPSDEGQLLSVSPTSSSLTATESPMEEADQLAAELIGVDDSLAESFGSDGDEDSELGHGMVEVETIHEESGVGDEGTESRGHDAESNYCDDLVGSDLLHSGEETHGGLLVDVKMSLAGVMDAPSMVIVDATNPQKGSPRSSAPTSWGAAGQTVEEGGVANRRGHWSGTSLNEGTPKEMGSRLMSMQSIGSPSIKEQLSSVSSQSHKEEIGSVSNQSHKEEIGSKSKIAEPTHRAIAANNVEDISDTSGSDVSDPEDWAHGAAASPTSDEDSLSAQPRSATGSSGSVVMTSQEISERSSFTEPFHGGDEPGGVAAFLAQGWAQMQLVIGRRNLGTSDKREPESDGPEYQSDPGSESESHNSEMSSSLKDAGSDMPSSAASAHLRSDYTESADSNHRLLDQSEEVSALATAPLGLDTGHPPADACLIAVEIFKDSSGSGQMMISFSPDDDESPESVLCSDVALNAGEVLVCRLLAYMDHHQQQEEEELRATVELWHQCRRIQSISVACPENIGLSSLSERLVPLEGGRIAMTDISNPSHGPAVVPIPLALRSDGTWGLEVYVGECTSSRSGSSAGLTIGLAAGRSRPVTVGCETADEVEGVVAVCGYDGQLFNGAAFVDCHSDYHPSKLRPGDVLGVTLTEEGRFQVEVNAEAVVLSDAAMPSEVGSMWGILDLMDASATIQCSVFGRPPLPLVSFVHGGPKTVGAGHPSELPGTGLEGVCISASPIDVRSGFTVLINAVSDPTRPWGIAVGLLQADQGIGMINDGLSGAPSIDELDSLGMLVVHRLYGNPTGEVAGDDSQFIKERDVLEMRASTEGNAVVVKVNGVVAAVLPYRPLARPEKHSWWAAVDSLGDIVEVGTFFGTSRDYHRAVSGTAGEVGHEEHVQHSIDLGDLLVPLDMVTNDRNDPYSSAYRMPNVHAGAMPHSVASLTDLRLDRLCDRLERVVDKLDLYIMSSNRILEMAHSLFAENARRAATAEQPAAAARVEAPPQMRPEKVADVSVDSDADFGRAGLLEREEDEERQTHSAARKSKLRRKSARRSSRRLEEVAEPVKERKRSQRRKSRPPVEEVDAEEPVDTLEARRGTKAVEESSDGSDRQRSDGARESIARRMRPSSRLKQQEFLAGLVRQIAEQQADNTGDDHHREAHHHKSRRSSASRKASRLLVDEASEDGQVDRDELDHAPPPTTVVLDHEGSWHLSTVGLGTRRSCETNSPASTPGHLPPICGIPRNPLIRHYRGPGILPHSADATDTLAEVESVKHLDDLVVPGTISNLLRKGAAIGKSRSNKGKWAPRTAAGRQNLNDLGRLVEKLKVAARDDRRHRDTQTTAPSDFRVLSTLTELNNFIAERSEEVAELGKLAKELTAELDEETFQLELLNQRTVRRLPLEEISTLSAMDRIKQRQMEDQEEEKLENDRATLGAQVADLSQKLGSVTNALKDARFLYKDSRKSKCQVLVDVLKVCTEPDGSAASAIVRELLEMGVTPPECAKHLQETCGKSVFTEPWMFNAFVCISAMKTQIDKLKLRLDRHKREAAGAMEEERSRFMSLTQSEMNHSLSSSAILTSSEGWRRATCRLVNEIKPSSSVKCGLDEALASITPNDEKSSRVKSLSRASSFMPIDRSELRERQERSQMSGFVTDVSTTEERLTEAIVRLETVFQSIIGVMRKAITIYRDTNDGDALRQSSVALSWLVGQARSRKVMTALLERTSSHQRHDEAYSLLS
ncbi:hypothetical protein FOL47_002506 [Perkinsus chesapeaki]|uniref:RING-type domain-containing protein n=1 Tax=Perkinsus chesapeaki TaxID=330153 RepID=A0A7J6N109_PERCH|nr:hypothetical protein FOL47_002506 [Perkinsus chesapeaki]